MTRKALVSALAATAVIVPVADAHTLSKAKAKKEAKKAAPALVGDLGGKPVYDCERVRRHKVDCQISLVTVDGSACATVVRVAYRKHRSRKTATRVREAPDCAPPGLPDLPGLR